MGRYWIDMDDFDKKLASKVDKSESVEVLVMSEEEKQWIKAKVIAHEKPVKKAVPLGLLSPFGKPIQREYYVEILETSSPED